MGAFLKPYSSDAVTIVFNGRSLTGKVDGDFVTIERSSDSATKYVGAGGDVAFAFNSDKSGTVTVPMMQNSPDHAYLAACEAARIIAPIEVKDLSMGLTLARGSEASVAKMPSVGRGKEIGVHEWVFIVGELDMLTEG